LRLLSGWLLHHLLSRRHLPSTCASASQHTAASVISRIEHIPEGLGIGDEY
jgi:hypothetical protein